MTDIPSIKARVEAVEARHGKLTDMAQQIRDLLRAWLFEEDAKIDPEQLRPIYKISVDLLMGLRGTVIDDAATLLAELDRVITERDDKAACFTELRRHMEAEGCRYRTDEFGAPYAWNKRAEAAESRVAQLEAELAEARERIATLHKAASDFEGDLSSYCDTPEREVLRAALAKGDHRGT